jgi:hypothetical protein
MRNIYPFEIQRFHSLTELIIAIDQTMNWYQWMLQEYDHHLGIIMREVKVSSGDLMKTLSLKKTPSVSKKKKKKAKDKGAKVPDHWFTFNNMQFSTLQISKAEIFFTVKDTILRNLDALQKGKQTLEGLAKKGMKADLDFLVYFEEGVPTKVFLEDAELAKKTQFEYSLVTPMSDVDASLLIQDAMEPSLEENDSSEEAQVLQIPA